MLPRLRPARGAVTFGLPAPAQSGSARPGNKTKADRSRLLSKSGEAAAAAAANRGENKLLHSSKRLLIHANKLNLAPSIGGLSGFSHLDRPGWPRAEVALELWPPISWRASLGAATVMGFYDTRQRAGAQKALHQFVCLQLLCSPARQKQAALWAPLKRARRESFRFRRSDRLLSSFSSWPGRRFVFLWLLAARRWPLAARRWPSTFERPRRLVAALAARRRRRRDQFELPYHHDDITLGPSCEWQPSLEARNVTEPGIGGALAAPTRFKVAANW